MKHLTKVHESFMGRCLELAGNAGRQTGLNPQVGAVLVSDGKIIAEGWHRSFGAAHAEADLFEQKIDTKINDCTLYVNLEPCCHTGKTAPCMDIIVKSGIKQVVFGMRDPNPKVAGEGIKALEAAGIKVTGPVLPELCRRVNRGFVSVMEQGRPYITLKSARSKTGAYSSGDGTKIKITSAAQDEWSHKHLRSTHDAILVGVQTILDDNPQLTTRWLPSADYSPDNYQNYRLILDPDLRVPLDARVVTEPLANRTIIVTTDAIGSYADILRHRGVRLWEVPRVNGLLDFPSIWQHCLATDDNFSGISSILVEGGLITWTAFRLEGCRDEEVRLVGV